MLDSTNSDISGASRMPTKPRWLTIGDELVWPLVGMGLSALRSQSFSSPDLALIPELALCHHAGCLEASMFANEQGKHSASASLVRQSVEALTIVEIGLQKLDFAEPLLQGWKEGRRTQGQLRAALEEDIWPQYGPGLWSETWAAFYANLARAVQPYSHYSPELQGWQFVTIGYEGGREFFAMTGLQTYDALQASRITLFHMLLTWMLGRMLLMHGKNEDVLANRERISELGEALATSKLLFEKGEWRRQFAPHMLFKPGTDWRDE